MAGKGLTKKQKMQVDRQIQKGVEFKFVDREVGVSVLDVGYIDLLAGNNISQGIGDSDYIGQRIDLQTLMINMSVYTPTSGVTPNDETNFMRVIIFQWKDDSTPTVQELLSAPSNYLSCYNVSKRQSYKVLWDKIFSITRVGTNAKSISLKTSNFARVMTFNNVGVSQKNQIYLLAISDSTAATNPILQYYSRVYYTDR